MAYQPPADTNSWSAGSRHSHSFQTVSQHGTFYMAREWGSRRLLAGTSRKCWTYLTDFFHTSVHWPWWRVLMSVCVIYWISWLFYASVAYALFSQVPCVSLGSWDDKGHLEYATEFGHFVAWTVQSMTTLGYGGLVPSCDGSNFLVSVMLVHGSIMEALTFGLVFAKFSSPAQRAKTVLISKAVCGDIQRVSGSSDQELCMALSFRLVNSRKHPLTDARLEVYLVDHRPLLETGEPPCFYKLDYTAEPPLDFLEYPSTVTCRFSSTTGAVQTPLHSLLRTLSSCGVEGEHLTPLRAHHPLLESLTLVAVFSAEEPSQSAVFEVRRTYPLAEICWGMCHAPMLTLRRAGKATRTCAPRRQAPASLLDEDDLIQTVLDFSKLDRLDPVSSLTSAV